MTDKAADQVGVEGGAGGRTPVAAPSPSADGKRPARPYRSPRLECYGELTEVTRFGGSRIGDSGAGLRS